MDLVNQSVIHKNFGRGMIVSVNSEKYLNVKFEGKDATCKFSYPQCFYGYLTLENCKLQSEIAQIVEIWKEEKGITEREKLYHQYEITLRGIENRRIAAKEKKMKASQRAVEHRTAYNMRHENKK